jgi:hypothetical protein
LDPPENSEDIPRRVAGKATLTNFSRDQIVPLIAAMGVWKDEARVQRSWGAMRSCNIVLKCVQGTKDIVGLDLENLCVRSLGLNLSDEGDTLLAAGTGVRLTQAEQNTDDVGDDLNLVVNLLVAHFAYPSQVSEQAIIAYSKSIALSSGCYLGHYRTAYPGDYSADETTMKQRIKMVVSGGWAPDCPRILGALRWYFRRESGGCPALAELYAPIVDQFPS